MSEEQVVEVFECPNCHGQIHVEWNDKGQIEKSRRVACPHCAGDTVEVITKETDLSLPLEQRHDVVDVKYGQTGWRGELTRGEGSKRLRREVLEGARGHKFIREEPKEDIKKLKPKALEG